MTDRIFYPREAMPWVRQMVQSIERIIRDKSIPPYTVATLPSAALPVRVIFVSDEAGGAVLAFNDGTDWRRVTDRAVVS